MLGKQHCGPGFLTTRRLVTLGVLASLCALALPLRAARADDTKAKTSAEVLIVLASGEDGTVDTRLSHVRALKKPPFSDYKTLKLLSSATVQLPSDEPVEIALPNGRTLVLRLVKKLPDGRAKLQLSITRPNRKEYLPFLEVIASAGEPFFVAGQNFQGGTLVLGIRAGDGLKLTAR